MADYKLSQLTEKTSLLNTDLMHVRTVGAIDQKITGENLAESLAQFDVLYQYLTLASVLSKSANYIILDTDLNPTILMTTGAASKTVTLPTVAGNTGKKIKLIKVDDGAGYAILDGEGAEEINGTLTWEVTEQWGFVEVVSDGSKWIVLNQAGCIYEIWDSGSYALTSSWANYYTLPNLVPGKYRIEFGITLQTASIVSYARATIATSSGVEDSDTYTVSVYGSSVKFHAHQTKIFYRIFLGNTTLYLNAKESADGCYITHNALCGKGYIRATRIG